MEFREERGIGYCGLACVLCSYEGHDDCPGCALRHLYIKRTGKHIIWE